MEIILHFHNSDPVLGEIEEMPGLQDTMVKVTNPCYRDGKDLHYLQSDVVTVLWPIQQLSFIEILPSEAEEQIISFVRE